MNNNHTITYRPLDPFSSVIPKKAEHIPSSVGFQAHAHYVRPIRVHPPMIRNQDSQETIETTILQPIEPVPPAVEEPVNALPSVQVEQRNCLWCQKVFVAVITGRSITKKYCSGSCRGRASEQRTRSKN